MADDKNFPVADSVEPYGKYAPPSGTDALGTVGVGLWQMLAVAGVILFTGLSLVESFRLAEQRQMRSLLILFIILPLVFVTTRLLFRDAWQTLLRRPRLLVPLGVLSLVLFVRQLLYLLPFVQRILIQAGWRLSLGSMPIHLSLAMLIEIVIWTAFAAWQTGLLLQWVRTSQIPTLSPWRLIAENFFAALVALCIGVPALLLALLFIMKISGNAVMLMAVLIGLFTVAWNLATFALLPACLGDSGPIISRVLAGFRISWANKGRWLVWVIAQLLLLGFFVFAMSRHSTSSSTTTNYGWSIQAFWIGGYENQCRWLSYYMQQVGAASLPIVERLLELGFLVFAIVIKLSLIRQLYGVSATPGKAPPSPGTAAQSQADPYHPPE